MRIYPNIYYHNYCCLLVIDCENHNMCSLATNHESLINFKNFIEFLHKYEVDIKVIVV